MSTKAGRRQRRRLEFKTKLLNATRELVASRGFEATTVSAITEAADVGQGTFYNYYSSREEIFLAAATFDDDLFNQVVESIRQGRMTVLDAIEQRARFAQYVVPRFLEVWLRVARDPKRREKAHMTEIRTALWAKMIVLVAMGQERGEIRKDLSAEDVTALLMIFTLGGHVCEALGGPALGNKKLKQPLVDFVWEHVAERLGPVQRPKSPRPRRRQ